MPVVNTDRKYKEKYKHTIKENHQTIREENKRRRNREELLNSQKTIKRNVNGL